MSEGLDLENMSTADFDEKLANLRDIIQEAIENFEGLGLQYEADDLRKKMIKEYGE